MKLKWTREMQEHLNKSIQNLRKVKRLLNKKTESNKQANG